jgi:putative nucleotidyltransferase with HDIG domain
MASIFIRDELINTALNLKAIPPHSNIIGKALKQLEQPDVSITAITDLLKNDLGVTSKLISIANSAFYRIGMPVTNIERAVMMIGQTDLKSVLFCLLYISEITNYLKFKKKDLFYMLKHSIFVAHAAQILSKRLLVEDPEDVFTVSLLHDIGKTVFFMNFDRYDEVINESMEKNIPLPVIEREKFGTDHQEIGNIIALKWKLPPVFISIIANHHNNWDSNHMEYQGIKRLLCLADRFFYHRDEEICPEIFILKKEADGIDMEIEKIIHIINK